MAIDTTKLANGTHRLMVRADSKHREPLVPGTNSGIIGLWFVVAN